MLGEILKPEVHELIRKKDYKKIKEMFVEWQAIDIADFLADLPEDEMIMLYRLLPRKQAARVFVELESEDQEHVLRQLKNQQLKEMILEISPDDRTEIFEELPAQVTQRLMDLLPSEERKEALFLLGYPENSLGRLMTPDYISVRPYFTLADALDHIRKYGKDSETINMVYVTDDESKLLDEIPIRRIILGNPQHIIESVMDYTFIAASAFDDQDEGADIMKRYDLVSLPVIDSEGLLIGIVTIDDIIDVMDEEATEDFQKEAAVSPLEFGYMATSPFMLYRKRIGWLVLLLLADFFSSGVIAHFEELISKFITLTIFIPILIDSGGNTATQSATLVIRAISLGELTVKRWFEVVKREILTGALLGVSLGGILFLRSYVWRGGTEVGFVLAISMVVIVFWTNIAGSVLPIILTKLNFDPAVVSSPLLTTMVDAIGLIIYFNIARILLLG